MWSSIFKFIQGYSSGAKAGRAFFHGAADVVTLGLWEIVGTSTKSVCSGDDRASEVRYDDVDRVDQATVLKRIRLLLTPGSSLTLAISRRLVPAVGRLTHASTTLFNATRL